MSEFAMGFLVGGVILFFAGIAAGWSWGWHAGWCDSEKDSEKLREKRPRVHNW